MNLTILASLASPCRTMPLLLVAVALLCGCANEVRIDDSVGDYADSAQQLEAPLSAEYRVRAGDEIEVKFHSAPELNELLTVRSDGRISMQPVGDLEAAGRTPSELAALVSEAFASTLRVPEATVIVRESSARIFVGGEIAQPAFVKLDRDMTLLQAIFAAGGFGPFAQPESVLLLRRVNRTERIVVRVDLSDTVKFASNDVQLTSDDVIFVPKSRIGKWDKIIEQYVQLAVPFQISYVKSPFYTTSGSLR